MTFQAPLAYRAKVTRDVWTNFSVLRHGHFEGVLVTSKNSGTHWIKYMFAVALAETHGLAPPAYFSEAAVRPFIGWPKDSPQFSQLPRLAFCHSIPHRLADWSFARRLADLPPYVLAVRHPMSILASHYEKWRRDLNVDWSTYLAGDPSGKRFRCDVYWLARFWNRWGDLKARFPGAHHQISYEATEADPRAVLLAMAEHFKLTLTAAAIDAALAAGTKTAMAQRIDPAAEPNVLQFRAASLPELFSGDTGELYRARVRQLFRHDLGYDLLKLPDAQSRAQGALPGKYPLERPSGE